MRIKVKVYPPSNGLKFDSNESLMKPIFTALGDLLCEGKSPPFTVAMGTAWFGKMETEAVELADGKAWSVKERILSCRFFKSVEYDRKIGEWEAEIRS